MTLEIDESTIKVFNLNKKEIQKQVLKIEIDIDNIFALYIFQDIIEILLNDDIRQKKLVFEIVE